MSAPDAPAGLLGQSLERVEDRKTFCTSQLHAGDLLCAEAEGIFVKAKPGKLEALVEKRVALEAELGQDG